MRRELNKTEVERLFLGAVDDALPPQDQATFAAELQTNGELKARFESYRRTVSLLKGSPKEKAPDALASVILRRSRRRRFSLRDRDNVHLWRVPAEVVIPLLLAALVAMFVLGSP